MPPGGRPAFLTACCLLLITHPFLSTRIPVCAITYSRSRDGSNTKLRIARSLPLSFRRVDMKQIRIPVLALAPKRTNVSPADGTYRFEFEHTSPGSENRRSGSTESSTRG